MFLVNKVVMFITFFLFYPDQKCLAFFWKLNTECINKIFYIKITNFNCVWSKDNKYSKSVYNCFSSLNVYLITFSSFTTVSVQYLLIIKLKLKYKQIKYSFISKNLNTTKLL